MDRDDLHYAGTKSFDKDVLLLLSFSVLNKPIPLVVYKRTILLQIISAPCRYTLKKEGGVIGQLCDTHNMIHLKTPNKFSEPSGWIDTEYTIINCVHKWFMIYAIVCIDISHSIFTICTSNSWIFVVGRRFGSCQRWILSAQPVWQVSTETVWQWYCWWKKSGKQVNMENLPLFTSWGW